MKGIITTNDPTLETHLKEVWKDWQVLISLNSKVIEFHKHPDEMRSL